MQLHTESTHSVNFSVLHSTQFMISPPFLFCRFEKVVSAIISRCLHDTTGSHFFLRTTTPSSSSMLSNSIAFVGYTFITPSQSTHIMTSLRGRLRYIARLRPFHQYTPPFRRSSRPRRALRRSRGDIEASAHR